MTFFTASVIIWEWYSKLKQNTIKVIVISLLVPELVIDLFMNVDSLEVSKHVSSTEQHGGRVGNIPSYSLCKRVACTLEKNKTEEYGNTLTKSAKVKCVSN